MIAAILRIVLLLLPLVALFMWLRWRMRTDRTEEELQADLIKLRKWLVGIIIVAIFSVLGLKFADESAGDARTKYIPPHTVDGKVVPGRFVPADEAEEGVSREKPEGEDAGDPPPN